MRRRGIAVVLIAAVLLLLPGCGREKSSTETREEGVQTPVTPTPEPVISAAPANLLRGVETDRKVVSLVFEGYTDDSTMQAIAEVLAAKKIPAVFFLSGITANEHPDIVQDLEKRGFTIGNYGMSGAKHLELNPAYVNAERFELAQTQIALACGEKPELLRCNATVYTEDVLRAAAAAGLSAAVDPTAYLNHRSFKSSEEAYSYALNILRGSILSVKLGQELDEDEYDDLGEKLDERPAIDPSPGIRWEWNTEEEKYASLPELVTWLIEALETLEYEFTDPVSLQREERILLHKTYELTPEEKNLLNPDAYALPVTEAPLSAGDSRTASENDFQGAVFVGDSVMQGISEYVNWKRGTEPSYLNGAQFLTGRNVTVESILDTDTELGNLGEELAQMDADSVWLCLGFTNPAGYVREDYMTKYRLLIKEIQDKNPGIRVVVLPVLPKVDGYGGVSNVYRFRLDLMLCAMCREYGLDYVDIASAVRDEKGSLREDFCLDLVTSGSHLNDAGCEAVLDYVRGHYPC